MKGSSKMGPLDFEKSIDKGQPQVEPVAPLDSSKGGKKPTPKKLESAKPRKPPVESSETGTAVLDKKDLVKVQAAYDLKHGEPVTLAIHYLDGGIKAALAELGRSQGYNLKKTVTAALREYLVRTGVRLE